MKTMFSLIFSFLALISNSQNIHYLPQDSIFFEQSTIPVFLDPSPGNIWQIGTPQKTWFNEAYSSPQAIVTDTLLFYPVNNTSIFSFVIDSNSIWNNPIGLATYFSFIHKFDTDTLLDYGIIEYSVDGGNTWCDTWTPFCFNVFMGVYLYWESDYSLSSHQYTTHPEKISGKSDGWIFSRFHFDYAVSKKVGMDLPVNSIMIRFTFMSDDIASNHEGWMIDNIIIGACDIETSVPELNKPYYTMNIIPNPLVDRSVLNISPGICINQEVQVFNEMGRLIKRMPVQGKTTLSFLRKDFFPGLYLLKTSDNDGKPVFGKFLVK